MGRGRRRRIRGLAPFIFGPEVPIEPVQIVFRLVGGSFAACGLVAWHRRPDSYSGRLMTATGFAFFASPLLAQLDSPVALTASYLLPDLWVLFFVPLLLTFLTGGRLRTRMDKVLTAPSCWKSLLLAPLFLVFTELDGNLLLVTAERRTLRRRSTACNEPCSWSSRSSRPG